MASHTGRISISVDADRQAQLDAIASSMDRSRSWLVNEAINQYLELYHWQEKKIRERLDRANSGKARFHTSDEIDEVVESFSP